MPSTISTPVPIRLGNSDIESLDKMVEIGGWATRSECLRSFIRPAFDMAKTAMETKSITKAFQTRMKAEAELMDHINQMIKASEIQTEFEGDLAPA